MTEWMEDQEQLEVRCPSGIKFAEIVGRFEIEVKCRSAKCGAGRGRVVIHRFDLLANEVIETRVFRSPPEGIANAADNNPVALWAKGSENYSIH